MVGAGEVEHREPGGDGVRGHEHVVDRMPSHRGVPAGNVPTRPLPVPSAALRQPPSAARRAGWSNVALKSPATNGATGPAHHLPISASSSCQRSVLRRDIGAVGCTA